MAHMTGTLRTGSEQLATALGTMEKLQNAGECLGVAADETQAFANHVLDRAAEIKREKPLPFLAVIAGLALVAGIATRVWRASAHT
jgi:hypothetical protein